MTTTNYTTVIDNSSTAGFRNWVNDLVTAFAAVGLVQTADTGQINTATVTLPGSGVVGGYQIWRFADSSLYMKWEYGSASNAAVPQIILTVGTGSNGSGTLTGQLSTRNVITGVGGTGLASTITGYTSYVCHVGDAFSLLWKARAGGGAMINMPLGFVVVGKTVDATGAGTTEGFGVFRLANNGGNYSPAFQSVRIAATAVTFGDTFITLFIPGQVSASLVGSNSQAYLMWLNTPAVNPFKWACGVINSEISSLTTFSVALVGSTPDTYLATGQPCQFGVLAGFYTAATYGFGFIYE